MRIILCSINSKFIHSSLGVWYLAASIRRNSPNDDIEVVEATINETQETIIKRINARNGDLIGFSTYIWNKNIVLEISRKIKEEKDVTVFLGGPEVSYNSKQVLEENQFVDFVICGEGEIPIAKIAAGEDIGKLRGISYRKNGVVLEAEPYISFDDPPSPYITEYFERLNGRIAYIETSRGCPFSCAFCLSGRCGGVRFFDIEKSKENIVLLANSGTQTVKFIDRTFNANKKRANEIFKFIIKNYGGSIPKGVRFHFEIEAELVDDEMVQTVSQAPVGLFQFEIGIQTFNKKSLESINRRADLDKLQSTVEKLLKHQNIHIHTDLIVGLPYEDLKSFKSSFNLAYKMKPHMLQIGFLKVLHGTRIQEEKEVYKYDFSYTPPYEINSNQWISKSEIEKLHLIEDVFEKLYNSQRFGYTLEYLDSKFDDSFDMYYGFASYIEKTGVENSLDDFTRKLFDYFGSCQGIDKTVLRDVLAVDRLATNRMGALPEFLKIKSPKLKSVLNELEKNEATKRPCAIKRAATELLSENKIVYVDYTEPNPITGRYEMRFLDV